VRRVLVLRASEDAQRTAQKLRAMGCEPVVSPVLDIVATGAKIPGGVFDAVLASSAKGLECAGDLDAPRALPMHCVGAVTARAAECAGWRPDIVAGGAEALLPLLRARYASPARFLYLAGRDRQRTLEDGLRAADHHVVIVETYQAQAASSLSSEARAALAAGEIAAVLHYSRRSAEIFLRLAEAAGLTAALATAVHLALSENVAEPLRRAGLAPRVATRPDETHVLNLLSCGA